MDYKITITESAAEDLNQFMNYLVYEKKSPQAAGNLLNDFEETKSLLETAAEAIRLCDNPALRGMGYRRINFISHRYFMLYRVKENIVYIDSIFHELQDFEGKLL